MIALAGACAVPMPQIPAGMHTPQIIPPQRMKSCADCLSKHCKRSPRQPHWIQEAPQVCMECTRQQCGPPICTPEKRQAHCHSELKANNASATPTGPAPMLPARAEGRFSMDLWSGLRAQQDIEPMKCGLLYFVHVPKTGCPLHRPPPPQRYVPRRRPRLHLRAHCRPCFQLRPHHYRWHDRVQSAQGSGLGIQSLVLGRG